MTTASTPTFALSRNGSARELAAACGRSESFAAGVLDAIDNHPNFSQLWTAGAGPSAAERAEYTAGYADGQRSLATMFVPGAAVRIVALPDVPLRRGQRDAILRDLATRVGIVVETRGRDVRVRWADGRQSTWDAGCLDLAGAGTLNAAAA